MHTLLRQLRRSPAFVITVIATLALGVGLTGASQINARLLDRVYIWLSERERKRWEAKRGEIEAGGISNSEKGGEKEKTPERKKFGRPEFRLRASFRIRLRISVFES